MPYSEAKLRKYKRILVEKKEQVLSRLSGYKESESSLSEYTKEPMDIEDLANFTTTEQKLSQIYGREYELLRSIEKALERIEDKSYGICEVCSGEIEEARLEIVPWTNVCAKCSKKFSS